jgi:hypothetical protein
MRATESSADTPSRARHVSAGRIRDTANAAATMPGEASSGVIRARAIMPRWPRPERLGVFQKWVRAIRRSRRCRRWPRSGRPACHSGGHGPVALKPGDAALHGVAQLVQLRVERGRPTARAALVLAVPDLVGLLRDRAPDPAPPEVNAVGAGAVGLAGQHPVRPGPRPSAPGRGTRIRPSTTRNCGLSPRWPAVMTTDSGFWPCSQARWILVVSPPRDRPRP